MATQMSPEGSTHSSTNGRRSFSTRRSSVPAKHTNPAPAGPVKDDIRDVQVDRGTTTSRGQGVDDINVPAAWNDSSKNMSK